MTPSVSLLPTPSLLSPCDAPPTRLTSTSFALLAVVLFCLLPIVVIDVQRTPPTLPLPDLAASLRSRLMCDVPASRRSHPRPHLPMAVLILSFPGHCMRLAAVSLALYWPM